MSFPVKVINVLLGLFYIGLGIDLLIRQSLDIRIIAVLLAACLIVEGIRGIVYYASMAQFMVEGWRVVLNAGIRIALGVFMVFFGTTSTMGFAVLSMMAGLAYLGIQDILMGWEFKDAGLKDWLIDFVRGALILILTIYSLFNMEPSQFLSFSCGFYLILLGGVQIYRTKSYPPPISIED